ncbi:olfactory receptor 2D2-like [Ambystoma mexicanum]|uniref:olfactory receptor 2D2-like n=1 Tax=Ambystoma mexicanum TaxID=8296 RepID=UPI0037E80387
MDKNGSAVTEFLLLGLSEDPHVNMALFVLFLLTFLLTMLSNAALVTACVIEPRLNTPMYFFLGNLSVLDMCFSSVSVPYLLAQLLSHRKICFSACAAQMFACLLFGCAECILLAIMAYDRYAAILFPLHYRIIMSRSRCVTMLLSCWAVSLIIGIVVMVLTLRLPLCGHNVINHFFCEATIFLKMACGDTFVTEMVIFSGSIVVMLIPSAFTLVSYMRISAAIMRIRSSEGRHKAFSTCASHLIVVILFYGTAIFMYMKPSSAGSANQDKIIALFYSVTPPLLNPVIYSLRNKDVKRALLKLSTRNRAQHFQKSEGW